MTFVLQIFCVFGLMACGFYARKRGLLSACGTRELARLATDIIYPALIFVSITSLSMADLKANWLLPLCVLGIALIGLLLGLIAVRFLGQIAPATARAFLFHCMVNNYLFLPMPLVLFIFGEHGVALLVFSSIGYELILWTVGVYLFRRAPTPGASFRQLLSPPFVTLVASLVWVWTRDTLGIEWQGLWAALAESVIFMARMMGQATITLAVLIAGSRFAVLRPGTMLGWRLWVLSVIRLVIIPIILLPLLMWAPLDATARGVVFIVAVMPSAMTSVVFSERFGGDTEFIAGGLLLTHLWALITVPLLLAWVL